MRRYLYTLKGFIADGAFHTSIFFIQGVYNGGTAILMTAVLFGLEPTSARRSYLADIFQGLPKDIDAFKWKSTVVESGVLAGKLKFCCTKVKYLPFFAVEAEIKNRMFYCLQGTESMTIKLGDCKSLLFLQSKKLLT